MKFSFLKKKKAPVEANPFLDKIFSGIELFTGHSILYVVEEEFDDFVHSIFAREYPNMKDSALVTVGWRQNRTYIISGQSLRQLGEMIWGEKRDMELLAVLYLGRDYPGSKWEIWNEHIYPRL